MIYPPDDSLTTLSLGPESLPMRKINTRNFRLATRSTPREVNRRIVLNLIREYQPISRAELARRMQVHRGTMTPLVRELVESGVVFEKGTAATARGRRPTLLCVRTRGRLVIAVDVRPGRSVIALADVSGHVLARESFDTPESPAELPELLSTEGREPASRAAHRRNRRVPGARHRAPGMVDRKTGTARLSHRVSDGATSISEARSRRRSACAATSRVRPDRRARSRGSGSEPEATRAVNSFAYVSVVGRHRRRAGRSTARCSAARPTRPGSSDTCRSTPPDRSASAAA
jgi:hypothetical protein